MAISLTNNLAASTAARNLEKNSTDYATSLAKLASGSRLAGNAAAADPAGVGRSGVLEVAVSAFQQATRNAGDAVSMAQVADGSLSEIGNLLIRVRELSVAAASDTVDDEGRDALHAEVQNLTAEIDRIANSTRYQGNPLINGQGKELTLQIGPNHTPDDRITYNSGSINAHADNLGVSDLDLTTSDTAAEGLENIDEAIYKLSGFRAQTGALQERLQSIQNTNAIAQQAVREQLSRIQDTDYATESTESVKRQILQQIEVAVLAQANSGPAAYLRLIDSK